MDEFQSIAKLFRPLTRGAPEALNLLDDAAVVPSRPGFDLVVTADALVEGVHFLSDDPPELVAKKLIRVNLSDLAAKAAEPYAYFLTVAWPARWDEARRAAFARGLGEDQDAFGLTLLGGDTVSTPGPLTLSVTMMGWTPTGAMVKRSGAAVGDIVLVSGTIGDGCLGLAAVRDELPGLTASASTYLANRYRCPEPRLGLRAVLREHATAAADVSDGLLADAGHIGEASGRGVEIDLDQLPLSPAAATWLDRQPDVAKALVQLATGGDDYEIVCTATPEQVKAATAKAKAADLPLVAIGRVTASMGLTALFDSREVEVARTGWRHP